MDLDLVNMKVCPQILSYIILGKLDSNSNVTQIMDLCIINNQLTEHPNQILLRKQEDINLQSTKRNTSVRTCRETALFTSNNQKVLNNSNKQVFIITYYNRNCQPNPKCVSHKKEECYADNPHLRPPRQVNKCRLPNLTSKIIIDFGAINHLINCESSFTQLCNIQDFSILGKLACNSNVNEMVDLRIINNQLTEHPNEILLRRQQYINIQSTTRNTSIRTSSKTAVFTSNNQTVLNNSNKKPFRITYYSRNCQHNPKCISHKKEECYADNPHLRQPRQVNKHMFNRLYASAH
ncbi:hypothetical protein O181_069694 [Austropuccinia psidii MF-1]|uniref:Uncharacterized protein n=1 Tax=Austropuccinia psidii MF-1 TaxID=1389203 RepID=A0A9Q3EZC8_9BASI|nr:hypothetical protein [Austropuccinia psidii MF-1]